MLARHGQWRRWHWQVRVCAQSPDRLIEGALQLVELVARHRCDHDSLCRSPRARRRSGQHLGSVLLDLLAHKRRIRACLNCFQRCDSRRDVVQPVTVQCGVVQPPPLPKKGFVGRTALVLAHPLRLGIHQAAHVRPRRRHRLRDLVLPQPPWHASG